MASSSQGFKLSASQKSRLDADIPFLWPDWGASVCKWLFTIVLALLIFSGAVASRIALIAIPKVSGNDADMFLALVIIIMVPYLIELARCLWLHGIVPGHDWPSPVAIFVVSILNTNSIYTVYIQYKAKVYIQYKAKAKHSNSCVNALLKFSPGGLDKYLGKGFVILIILLIKYFDIRRRRMGELPSREAHV